MSHTTYAEDEEPIAVAYIELAPNFIVNNASEGSRLKYIKTSISIRTELAKKELIEANMPLVRDALVMFLSSLSTPQVTGAIAREQTRGEAAIAVNKALEEETGIAPVTDILFASFVTQ
ncbi:flagellar basal body-associated FliL family protein [Marinomonas ushuaiensis]|nr:flagellar basal body-associated FliL family protein [Marinomonas ushuaiensis]